MRYRLEGLRPRAGELSYPAAVGGCLDYLGVDASVAWLEGGTGLAFMACMSADADIAAPIAWDGLCVNDCGPRNPGIVARLERNLGYESETVCSCPFGAHRQTEEARAAAWRLVQRSLADGVPCIGFELAYPEFFVIDGIEDESYTFIIPANDGTTAAVRAALGWSDLAREIGWVRVQAICPVEPAPDEAVVREALATVHERMNREAEEGMFVTGLRALDLWARALEQGEAQGFGHRRNAAAWAELRRNAVGFLREARDRLNGRASGLLDEAIGHYAISAERMEALHQLHPVREVEGEKIRSEEGAQLLREALAAETEGLPLLARIAAAV